MKKPMPAKRLARGEGADDFFPMAFNYGQGVARAECQLFNGLFEFLNLPSHLSDFRIEGLQLSFHPLEV